ncbi:hypothetical protein [Phenylobacterium sp.]|uniref:hypothetical protein n=1 Tax=Phenylobacterium sp. TaxID=1871053 RepID=UPI00271E58FB|nr:hypothetical protein [Phenylobacterium sp.]MDO8379277.1 hypothetical protein [Phenylobacterium sp.]
MRTLFTGLLKDNRGLASVEATIVLATLGVALIAGGYAAGPAIKAYAERLSGLVVEARCLSAAEAGQPLPESCPAGPG